MRSRRKRLEAKAGTIAFSKVRKWLLKKDLLQAEKIGERLGRIAYKFGKSRRERTISNLELAFPEKTPQERMDIAIGVFEHFGRLLCDFVRSDTRSTNEVLQNMELDGHDNFSDMLPPNEAFILLTAHFGNWERLAQYITLNNYKLAVVVRDANDDELNKLVVDLRQAAGLEIIPRGSAARQVLMKLKRNEPAGILADQNSDEAFPLFFGKPAGTVLGPAVLAQRAKVKLYVAFCYRSEPGKYRFRLMDVIDPVSEQLEPVDVMQRYNRSLETIVREFPDQYLWMHNRWKSARQRGLV